MTMETATTMDQASDSAIHAEEGSREGRVFVIDRNRPLDQTLTRYNLGIWRGPLDGECVRGPVHEDERSLALTKIRLCKDNFRFLARKRERITYRERLTRLIAERHIRLDVGVGLALLEEDGQATLEWLRRTYGIVSGDFPGTILNCCGQACVLHVFHNGITWCQNVKLIIGRQLAGGPSAIVPIADIGGFAPFAA